MYFNLNKRILRVRWRSESVPLFRSEAPHVWRYLLNEKFVMRVFKPKSLEDFHLLFRGFRSHDGIGHWFRGQSDSSWPLLPKAGRDEFYLPNNRDLGRFRDWCNHAMAYSPLQTSKIENLAIAQHYGLATRLLDWTMNPLVAAFFCCSENKNTEGTIYVLEPPDKFIIEKFNFDYLENYNGVLSYIPNSISPRILNQKGLFTVHCDAKCEIEITESILGNGEPSLSKILIESEFKSEVLQMIDDYGINQLLLFPDLDGLSCHMNFKTQSMVQRK